MRFAPTSGHADAFADLLERGGRTNSPALAPYVGLAEALAAVPAVAGPSPEFRSALRQRLMAVAAVQGVGRPASPTERLREAGGSWRNQRRMMALAGGAAAVTAIAGVGVGASRALPGDPLYAVKRATEQVQLATAQGQEAKGERHLEFARTRLAELQALLGRSSALPAPAAGPATAAGPVTDQADVSTVVGTLDDMNSETRAGVDDLFAVYRSSGDTGVLQKVDDFARAQYAGLRHLLPAVPAGAAADARQSLALLTVVADRTTALAGSPAPSRSGHSRKATPTPTRSPHHPAGTGSSGSPDGGSTTGGGTDGGGSPSGGGSDGQNPVKTQAPDVPTIPSLPTPLPTTLPSTLPTILPTELPTLPLPTQSDLLGGLGTSP